jgi:hypothetical protein
MTKIYGTPSSLYAFGTSLVTVSCFNVISNHYLDARPKALLLN